MAFFFPCFFQPSANDTSEYPSLSSTIFALCMTGVAPYKSPNSPLNGFPAIIWRVNWLTPAYGETISLTLQEDGDLTLRGLANDGVEAVAWRSNMSGMGVTRMEFSQQPPNLILYDAGNSTVWQSSNYPTNTLMYGQALEEGMILVSYAWLDNISEAEYSLEIDSTLHQLALFYKKYASSQKIPHCIWQLNGTSPSSVCHHFFCISQLSGLLPERPL
ncbi:hypothetical protein L7F22_062709 [Adiantum nelumboides]|nr:hypothetical protein [Adiantum nelumboides]